MSAHLSLAFLILVPGLALAAAPAAPAPPEPEKPAAATPAPAGTTNTTPSDEKTTAADGAKKPAPGQAASESDDLRKEVNAKVEAAKKELREEIRAQMATQSVAQSWEEEWVDERRKLELLTLDGYFRVRPELFHNFDLRRRPDPGGHTLFPTSPASAAERTIAGVNMRLRLDPTINISEEVRLRMQIDGLDNVVMGTTPEYAFSRSERANFAIFSQSQVPPVSGLNAVRDSIALKRVYGEVTTPVGVLRFGRMGSQWGLGMLHNDGNCLDCDFGDTVDRIQFVTQPLPGIFVAPMIDFNSEGPTSARFGDLGQPVDRSQSDDAHSYVVAIARRDTEQQARTKLANGQAVINAGLHFTYRSQHSDPVTWFTRAFGSEGGDATNFGYAIRDSWLVIPDVWLKYETKNFRVELEAASRFGRIGSVGGLHGLPLDDRSSLSILSFGAVAQGEYRLVGGKLRLGVEAGFASGDQAPGMGVFPGRNGSGANGFTREGDIDGPQYNCAPTGGCSDGSLRNFLFNHDYRVDLILWRELIGGITDALYVKPSVDYELADGLHLQGAMIYSRAIYAESTPAYVSPSVNPAAANDAGLGVELDGRVRYETEDGFFMLAQAGILFPLGGLNNVATGGAAAPPLENATSFRATMGVRF